MSTTRYMPTPAGGDRVVTTYLAADGTEAHNPATASTIKVVEYSGPHELKRTYMQRGGPGRIDGPPMTDPGTTMTDPQVEEDVKNTYDLFVVEAGMWTPVRTREDLLQALGVHDKPLEVQRTAVGHAMMLDSWRAAPESLVAEVGAWLVNTRPLPPLDEPAVS
jgi:hypothetical protein